MPSNRRNSGTEHTRSRRGKSAPTEKTHLSKLETSGIGRHVETEPPGESAPLATGYPDIDPGVIEVALALAALSALLFTSLDKLGAGRLIAILSFFLSSYAAGRFYFSFLLHKYPHYIQLMEAGRGLEAFIPYYASLAFRTMTTFKPRASNEPPPTRLQRIQYAQSTETEFAYLSVLAAFALVWLLTMGWMLISILPS